MDEKNITVAPVGSRTPVQPMASNLDGLFGTT